MKLLFAYRYGALGGVPTQLINRLSWLRGNPGVSAEVLFARDYGAAGALARLCPVHLEPDGKRFAKLCAARRYDVIVVIDTEEYLEGLRDAGLEGRAVLEVHTTVDSGLKYLERSWSPAGYVVPSEYSRGLLTRRHDLSPSLIHVVPNIIDAAVFHPVPMDTVAERPIVLWVGRIDEHKNWEGFLGTCALISMSSPDVDFWMVGGDTAPEELSMCLLETVEGLGLMRRFRWFPQIDYGAMPRLYSHVAESGGCALVTSKDESFGMSVVESLLSGCPVVSSAVGAIPELGEDRPWLRLYPFGEVDTAAELVRRTLFEDRRAVRRALFGDLPGLAERFSPATVGPRYLATLELLAGGPRG